MPIDIDLLTESELIDLNHRIVARLQFLRQSSILALANTGYKSCGEGLGVPGVGQLCAHHH